MLRFVDHQGTHDIRSIRPVLQDIEDFMCFARHLAMVRTSGQQIYTGTCLQQDAESDLVSELPHLEGFDCFRIPDDSETESRMAR